MANEVFNRDTLLDLVVNGVPWFIHVFFIGVFLLLPYFGFEGLESILAFGILVVSTISLTILSYIGAKAITRGEREAEVYVPGQANVEGSVPLTQREEDRIWEEEAEGDEGTPRPDDDQTIDDETGKLKS